MTTSSRSDPKHLIDLAARMGIPADDAIRQVTQLIADADRSAADGAADVVLQTPQDAEGEVVTAASSPVVA